MHNKAKGSRVERELLHLFWDHGFYCLRVAGSGSMPFPCPDLLAGKNTRSLAIECKSGKKTRYIEEKQVQELLQFAKGFGAEAWIGMRFDGMEWLFLKPSVLERTGKHYSISKDLALRRGISFPALIKR